MTEQPPYSILVRGIERVPAQSDASLWDWFRSDQDAAPGTGSAVLLALALVAVVTLILPSRARPVRVLGRLVRTLPGRAADLLRARRLLGQSQHEDTCAEPGTERGMPVQRDVAGLGVVLVGLSVGDVDLG